MYVGGGYVADGGSGYEDGDEDVGDYLDQYDLDFEEPPRRRKTQAERDEEEERAAIQAESGVGPEEGIGPPMRDRPEVRGDRPIRREERSREHPQFAKKYDVEINLDALRTALSEATERPESRGAVRWDDIYDRAGEVAGVGFWVGFGRDVSEAAAHQALLDAFRSVGVDISQTLIGAGNLRRGLERSGATLKQSFFRVFVPAPGWKLLPDWTILREDQKKEDVRPELQEMVRERQRTRRTEIMRDLRRAHLERTQAAELAREREARLLAEATANRLAAELAAQDAAILERERQAAAEAAAAAAKSASRPAPAPAPAAPSGWVEAARRSRERQAAAEAAAAAAKSASRPAPAPAPAPPAPPAPAAPSGWVEAARRSRERQEAVKAAAKKPKGKKR